jgi:hypothetical protein
VPERSNPALSPFRARARFFRDAVAFDFEPAADAIGQFRRGGEVEEHGSRQPDKPPRPGRDHQAAEQPHHRVDPRPGEKPRREQSRDRQDRGDRIRQHVQIGGAVIVVVVVMGVLLVMRVPMILIPPEAKRWRD